MNRIRTSIISLSTLLLVTGCKTTSRTENSQTSHPPTSPSVSENDKSAQLITTFGEHRIGNTLVEVSESERQFTVKHLSYKEQPFGGKSTSTSSMSTPPDEWPLHEGWFAYAHQNGAYVWLYNGSDKMLLVERKDTPKTNFTNIYGPENTPIPIPTAILKHIKEPFRSQLTQN